ncbi:serine protease [Verrucomicrobia bacterium]|nr:serine protease [Verrucomicrobiota bacterium]
MKTILIHLSLFLFLLIVEAAEPEKSVIQIFTFSQEPDWDEPWNSSQVRRATGSGFVIEGNRIMTNAHVVSWAKQIMVRRFQDSRPHLAQVAYVGHDCDLALLEVEDETFFEGLKPLPIGVLPEVRSVVNTIGYPAGGEQISYTSGVVSRVELINYVQPGNRSLLAVQTDAAINPGNSGGPVMMDDQVVGVAFQGTPGLENTGFFIPPPVIQHFLKDVQDTHYHGFPQAGIRLSPLINPAYRKYLKLEAPDLGARIDTLMSDSAKEFYEKTMCCSKPMATLFQRIQLSCTKGIKSTVELHSARPSTTAKSLSKSGATEESLSLSCLFSSITKIDSKAISTSLPNTLLMQD